MSQVGDKDFSNYAKLVPHPKEYRKELQTRVANMLSSPIDVYERLWEAQISNGVLGTSGMFNEEKTNELKQNNYKVETLALFRCHHSLADGVSVCSTLGDASEEAEYFREEAEMAFNKMMRKKNKNILKVIHTIIHSICFLLAVVYALLLQVNIRTLFMKMFRLI